MKMKIEIVKTELEEMLERVEMKGKYFDGDTAKGGVLSPYAYAYNKFDKLFLLNGDNTTACLIVSEDACVNSVDDGDCVLDIDKTVKYLSPFDTNVVFNSLGGYLEMSEDVTLAKLPLVVEHPAKGMVDLLNARGFNTIEIVATGADTMPTFGKTQYESRVKVNVAELELAVKHCDKVNNARYELKFQVSGNDPRLSLSSERSHTDGISTEITVPDYTGSGATVEFTGNILKFLKGVDYVTIFLKDDSPVLFVTESSIMVKAPYLRR